MMSLICLPVINGVELSFPLSGACLVPGKAAQWPALSALMGGSIHNKLIEQQFAEALRLAASIQQGTVTASLILRKLGAYPRQNS